MKFFILKANLNCADDNVLYAFGSSMTEVKDKLSQDLPKLSEWFTENFMILNPDKCHYMCLGKDTVNDILNFCDEELKSSELETVLGIEIDQKLTFNCHVKTLCSKAAKKLSALQRIDNIIDEEKRNLLFNAIIKSQFSYCPLVWMFCSRRSNNLINNIHERALRATFDDHTSNFTQLLEKKREFTIHQQNIQALMKEIYKFTNNLSPPIINHMFQFRENSYNLRNFQQLASSTKKTTKMGLETISYHGPQLWNLVPQEIKESASFLIFKDKIKKWNCTNCPCTFSYFSRQCWFYMKNISTAGSHIFIYISVDVEA